VSNSPDAGFLSYKRIERGPWQALERAAARLFEHQGWPHVALVGGTGDKGADIIISDEKQDFVIQVKFKSSSSTPVNKDGIRELKQAMDAYSINRGILITNTRLATVAHDYMVGLKKTGYDISKVEGLGLLSEYEKLPSVPAKTVIPRDYQLQVIDSLWKTYLRGTHETMVALATGLGKTFVAGSFLKRVIKEKPHSKILILANQRPLLLQFDQALWKHLPKDISTHIWDGIEEPSYQDGVILATFQKLANIPSIKDTGPYEIIIVDEAHHAGAYSYNQIISKLDYNFLVGLTATPWRSDRKELREIFGPPCSHCIIDIIQALRQGYLAKVDYRLFCDNLDWDLVNSKSSKSYTIRDLNTRLFLPERDEKIISEIKNIWDKVSPKRAIIYCSSKAHADRMEAHLRDYGFKARCLHSGLDFRETERRLREFRKGNIQIITSMNMLNEGVDVPEVDLIIFLRVTHSRIIFLQQLGRGLRLSEGKEKVIVLDFVADIKRIRATIDIDSGVSRTRDNEKEVLKGNFKINFSSQQAQTFFEEYLKDKAIIEDESDECIIRFP
jgi:superfamily II DNA or RNA helicase